LTALDRTWTSRPLRAGGLQLVQDAID